MRQGFWNGSHPPYGYKTQVAERRGGKDKKVLVINEDEAEVVREILALASGREGRPLGAKAITCRLTERGLTRRGVRFSTGSVYGILTDAAYHGQHYFNRRDSRTGEPRPPSQWVGIKVHAIIEETAFNEVQGLLQSRNPKRTPPRVVNGPTFLAGLARCGYWRRHDPEHRQERPLPLLLLLEQAQERTLGLSRSADADGEAGRDRGRRGRSSGSRP